jgi:hypothetical protein
MKWTKFTKKKYFAISSSFPDMQTVSSPNFNIHFHIDNHHHYADSQTSPITHGYTTLTLASSDLRSLTAARKTRQSILGSDWYDSKYNADIRMLLKTSWRPLGLLEYHLESLWWLSEDLSQNDEDWVPDKWTHRNQHPLSSCWSQKLNFYFFSC